MSRGATAVRLCLGRLGLALLCLGAARGAVAGDEERRAEELSIRFFDVGALVAGKVDFQGEHVGVVEPAKDEEGLRDQFPSEAEEPDQPLGSIEELLDVLKRELPAEAWSEAGHADARVCSGRMLVVRQRPPAHAVLGAALRGWEERLFRSITLEVQALRPGDEAQPAGPDAVAARVERATAEPGLSLTCVPGQRVSAFAGTRRAFVLRHDLTSAEAAVCADPVVALANLGLGVDARAVPAAAADRVHVWICARLAHARSWDSTRAGAEAAVASPLLDEVTIDQRVELRLGRWTLLDGAPLVGGTAGWSFAVRAQLDQAVPGAATTGLEFPTLGPGDLGALATRQFTTVLFEPSAYPRYAWHEEAVCAGWAPMERELVCPCETFSRDALEDLVRETLGGDRWPGDAVLGGQDETFLVRAPARVLPAVAKTIESLERALLRSVEVEAEVLDVPADLPLTAGSLLSDREAQELAAAVASGDARRIDTLRLTSLQGANNAISAGEVLTYVQDLDPLSPKVCQGVPQRRPLRDGPTLEVAAVPTSAGDAVYTTVRFLRTWVKRPLAVAETALGEVQLPEVRTVRLRTSLLIPLGATAVVGSTVADGRRTVLLLTPRMRRAE